MYRARVQGQGPREDVLQGVDDRVRGLDQFVDEHAVTATG